MSVHNFRNLNFRAFLLEVCNLQEFGMYYLDMTKKKHLSILAWVTKALCISPGIPRPRTLSLVRLYENILTSKNENSDISISDFKTFGRETNQPKGCSFIENQRLDIPVTKMKQEMHPSNWSRK